MKLNIVKASALAERGALRLDAEFVDPEILQLEQKLQTAHGALPLSTFNLLEVKGYAKPKRPGTKIQSYIAIDDIDDEDGFIFSQHLSEEELPSRAKFELAPFDIVISNVRPERGAVGLVMPSQRGSIGSSGLTAIRVGSAQTRNLLFAYLRSNLARSQLIRRSRGSMYPAITKDDVPEILIPALPRDATIAISTCVDRSIECRESFLKLLKEQDEAVSEYLYGALGDPPPDIVFDIADRLPVRLAKRTEFFSTGAARFDAEFHRKEFVDFEARLKRLNGVIRLGSAFEAFAGGNPGKGASTLHRLRQAQLSGFGIIYSGCEEVENGKAPAKFTLRPDDVLIGCTAHEPHYVGNRVDLVDRIPVALRGKIVPVPDVMIIRQRRGHTGPTPAFVASFLRTKWGRRQFQRLNRGVRGGHVYGQDVEAFIYLPTPSSQWMSTFNERQELIRAARHGSIVEMRKAVGLIDTTLA